MISVMKPAGMVCAARRKCRRGAFHGLVFAVLITALGCLAGCGFQPLYGTRSADSGDAARDHLAATRIGIIDNREGQILHNFLLDRFNPTGRPVAPRHELDVTLSISSSSTGGLLDATTTRAQLSVTAIARLRAFDESFVFQSYTDAGYSTVASDFATNVALKAAIERSMRVIADDLRLQIASFFHKRRMGDG